MAHAYSKAVEYLYRLQRHGIKLGLENIERTLSALGDPHRRFRSIHVAGTNGKGSTAAMLASVLTTAGYRTGLYTSPHLLEFTERIRIDGEPVSKERVAELTQRVRAAGGERPLTFFEFTTAMAFQQFADSGVDLAVAEVGLGGRFDATNLLLPKVAVITNVELDHQEFLGDRIELIAGEKAGIIKSGTPVVTAATRPEAIEVIERIAREHNAPLYRLGRDVRAEGESPQRFRYRGIRWDLSDLKCPLLGQHQLQNAGCALAALELMEEGGLSLNEAAVREGIRTVGWPGRLEWIPASASRAAVLLDGAHNPAAARSLRAFLETAPRPAGGRLILVFGVMRDKDIDGILAPLAPLADEIVLTRPNYERAAEAKDLERRVAGYSVRTTVREPVREAVRYARSVSGSRDWILVTGSLFVIGEAGAALGGLDEPSPLRG